MADSSEKKQKMGAKKKSKKTKQPEEFSDQSSKMSSMKTSSDVISRLLWDESLPKEKFTVGYLDRFVGILEKPFTDLDWNHPSTVDNYTLALPKHRICYFKYRNRKVWDKTKRLDIVFGSTGSHLSIYELMEKVDKEKEEFQEENAELSDSNHTASDDDVIYDTSDRPNYFIAVRIDNEETIKNLKEVSDYIQSEESLLSECCISPQKYHLTLTVLKLDSLDEIENVVSTMQNVSDKKLPSISLGLQGLDDFRQRVLFSQVDFNSELMNLRNILVDELVEKKIKIADRFSFVPHVTVTKLSRGISRIRHSNYIDQHLYLKFEDNNFGLQIVHSLYLCEMGAQVREDGFYRCAAEIRLT